MLNLDYSKCLAEIVHVLRSLVLDASLPPRWPFHESSLMAYALRFVSSLVNFVAFTSSWLLNIYALYIITMHNLFFENTSM